ncbi:MAG: hypothetical protein AAFR66_23925 [Bacteroidota bacterium]
MKKCIPLLLVLFLLSCSEENILQIEETPDHSPTIIEVGKGSFKYSLNSNLVVEEEGFGATLFDIFHTISSSEVKCVNSSGTQVHLNPEEGAYAIFLLGDTKEDMIGTGGALRADFNGEEQLVFLDDVCGEQNIEVEIDSLSEEYISGTLSAFGYRFINTQASGCEAYENVGIVEVSFAVPLIKCE